MGRLDLVATQSKKRIVINAALFTWFPKFVNKFNDPPLPGRLGVGGSNPLAPTIFLNSSVGWIDVGVEPAPARDACATIVSEWLLRWPAN